MKVHNPNNLPTLPISDLLPTQGDLKDLSEKNYNKLKNTIENRGFSVPVYVWEDKDGIKHLLDGHQRRRVLETEGWNEPIPYLKVPAKDLQEAMARLLEITSQYGTITQEGIDEFIAKYELPEADVYEATSFDGLSSYGDDNEVEVEEDEAPEVSSEPAVSVLGEVYQLGRHRVMCGDSTDKDAVEVLMDGAKADMVFTDPPYNIDYGNIKHPKFKVRQIENDNMSGEDFKVFCDAFADNIKTFNKGCVYVCGPPGPDGRVMFVALDEALHCSTVIIWNKDQFTLGRGKYQNKYEPIWFGWNESGNGFYGDRKQTNVWDMARPKRSDEHPTMKPIELMARAINHASRPDDMVLDLFLGSGSTLIACEQTDRTCYGMELDPKYTDVIRKRWVKYVHGEEALENDKWIELTPAIE
jgi:DNA modification methylase